MLYLELSVPLQFPDGCLRWSSATQILIWWACLQGPRSFRQVHHIQSPMLSRSSGPSIPRDVQEFLDRYKYDPRLADQARPPAEEVRYSQNWEFYSEAVVDTGRGRKETRKCVPNNLTISELQAKYVAPLRIPADWSKLATQVDGKLPYSGERAWLYSMVISNTRARWIHYNHELAEEPLFFYRSELTSATLVSAWNSKSEA